MLGQFTNRIGSRGGQQFENDRVVRVRKKIEVSHMANCKRSHRNGTGLPLRREFNLRSDRGSATAEYAVATMAAVGFAGLLVVILRGDEVRSVLTDMVRNALSITG